MTNFKEIREEAIRRLIFRYGEEFESILQSITKEVERHGGILK